MNLNSPRCVVRRTEAKGRGVYASCTIPRQTVIEISPVLLFSEEEYQEHGKFTILDHYTFKWSEGRMALALGLGSLFNHSKKPNVSYTIDIPSETIRYETMCDIQVNEELCILSGHKLWFNSTEAHADLSSSFSTQGEVQDGWGGLFTVGEAPELPRMDNPFLDGDTRRIIADEKLPFTRVRSPPEEEEIGDIQTVQAWVVDIPDQRQTTKMLKWLKQAGLDTPNLGHLKRIKKHGDTSTLLLTTSTTMPKLPDDIDLPNPYTLLVPVAPALTLISHKLKSTFWPTLFTPQRKGEAEEWSQGKACWAWEAMSLVIGVAIEARTRGELPIAAYIPAPYEDKDELTFTAYDSRASDVHPLRHAVMNVTRRMADHRAMHLQLPSGGSPSLPTLEPEIARNGTNYLLTSRTLFTTHEPCVMCSMALIHSRVKEVIYLHPMPKTGGCGGATCLPMLKGVNHRFRICQWKAMHISTDSLHIDATIDA